MCKDLQSKNPVDHHIITQTAAPDLKRYSWHYSLVFISANNQNDRTAKKQMEQLELLTFLPQMSQMDFYSLLALFSKNVGILIILTIYNDPFLVYFHAVI